MSRASDDQRAREDRQRLEQAAAEALNADANERAEAQRVEQLRSGVSREETTLQNARTAVESILNGSWTWSYTSSWSKSLDAAERAATKAAKAAVAEALKPTLDEIDAALAIARRERERAVAALPKSPRPPHWPASVIYDR